MRNSKGGVFRFKRFDCLHGSGSMKIGVDGVLLGAWADVDGADRILDVGTGCGVISLMCAQRNLTANIVGIDIDAASVSEAAINFANSPWAERLEARLEDFLHCTVKDVGLIVSNPPYFNSGIDHPDTRRLVARHTATLGPRVILERGVGMLSSSGRIAMIVPSDQRDELETAANAAGLSLSRLTWVKGHTTAPVKRILMEFTPGAVKTKEDILILETSPGTPTEAHRQLCHDFYLKF